MEVLHILSYYFSSNTEKQGFMVNAAPYWGIHAAGMVCSFLMLVSGVIIARTMREKRWWFKAHRALGILGSAFAVFGVGTIIFVLSVMYGGHFVVPHAYLGISTLILALVTPVLGFLQPRSGMVRTIHPWWGRTVMVLMAVTITVGLFTAGLL